MPTHIDGIEQQPMHGVTFADSLTDADAPERHTQQYFETIGNRSMYKDGWWLSMRTERIPWVLTPDALKPYTPGSWDPDADPTELYYLPDDFTQANDLAAEHPEKVKELKELFWQEAEKYKVLPLMAPLAGFFGMLPPLPEIAKFEFRGDVQNVLSGMIPRIYNHSYSISADLVVPPGGAEGVIVAEADHLGGFSLFVDDGKLTHTYSMMGVFVFRQQAEEPLPEGEVTGPDGVRRRLGTNGHRRRGHPFHRRPPGGQGQDGAHRPDPLLRLRGDGHRPRQRWRRRPLLRGPQAVRLHRQDREGHLRHRATPLGGGEARAAQERPPRPHGPRADGLTGCRREENPMKLHDTIDVLIGGYLSKDAAEEDYNAVRECGGHLQGAVVVSKDLEGELSVEETDHMVREGAAGLGAVGFAVGLFAPPLLAATAVGAALGAGAGESASPQGRRQDRGAGGRDDPDSAARA